MKVISEMLKGSFQNTEWQFQKCKKVISETQNGTFLMCLTDFQGYYFEFSTFENMENLDFKKKSGKSDALRPDLSGVPFGGYALQLFPPKRTGTEGGYRRPKKNLQKKNCTT